MKNIKHVLMNCAAAAVLTACSTPAPTTSIGFNYEIDNGRASGIVQVFDLGGNTVVQVRDLNHKTTHFLDEKNMPIPFSVVGENVVFSGIHPIFTVTTSLAASRVKRKSTAPVEPSLPSPTGLLDGAPLVAAEQGVEMANEIARMRNELAELKALLSAPAPASTQSSPPRLAATEQVSPSQPSVVIVAFQNNSRKFNPQKDQRNQLESLSRKSETISIRGFTDSDSPSSGSIALAKARAEAAKVYLVSMGVAPAKIAVDFDGSGSFIADNRSAAGRAANRRVEIAGM